MKFYCSKAISFGVSDLQGGPEGAPHSCVIESDRACFVAGERITVAKCDEAAIRRESHKIDTFFAPHGGAKFPLPFVRR